VIDVRLLGCEVGVGHRDNLGWPPVKVLTVQACGNPWFPHEPPLPRPTR